jgi:Domain of unknown function (DUF4148)
MSNTFSSLSITIIVAFVGATAYADTGKTREEVRAETMAAIRSGDSDQGNGFTARSMAPGMYPAAPAVAGKARAEVEADLAQALRNGDVDEGNGSTARDMSPGLYPAAPLVAGKSRAEVEAELMEAKRTGTMPAEGRITMTQREEFPQLYRQQ